jgi:hypothetical protein
VQELVRGERYPRAGRRVGAVAVDGAQEAVSEPLGHDESVTLARLRLLGRDVRVDPARFAVHDLAKDRPRLGVPVLLPDHRDRVIRRPAHSVLEGAERWEDDALRLFLVARLHPRVILAPVVRGLLGARDRFGSGGCGGCLLLGRAGDRGAGVVAGAQGRAVGAQRRMVGAQRVGQEAALGGVRQLLHRLEGGDQIGRELVHGHVVALGHGGAEVSQDASGVGGEPFLGAGGVGQGGFRQFGRSALGTGVDDEEAGVQQVGLQVGRANHAKVAFRDRHLNPGRVGGRCERHQDVGVHEVQERRVVAVHDRAAPAPPGRAPGRPGSGRQPGGGLRKAGGGRCGRPGAGPQPRGPGRPCAGRFPRCPRRSGRCHRR